MESTKEIRGNKLKDLFKNYFPAFEFKYPQHATQHINRTTGFVFHAQMRGDKCGWIKPLPL
ncbi:MAG: hypothetical protein FD145_1507 [Candidatus Saganbacteria bacterium]|uniref:Uncharacterized protein n=1 Tax=Candidatus Saganbacteria bacterium TaxID=2575572 RepID=A0A833KZQ0_UNCSA|nr:MAG: hypothetical protein FD145_1507 [Candidatus Saganbacteria bacterium]